MLQNSYVSTFPTLSLIPGINNSGGGNDFRNLHFCFNSGNSLLSGNWLRPIALGPPELPRHQAGASAAATRGAYLTRSRLKVDDFGDFTVGWRARAPR